MFAIGVAGQAQMGKDTLSDYLADKLNARAKSRPVFHPSSLWSRVAFADNVKKVYQDTFDRSRDFVELWKTNPDPPPGFDMTVRKSLQFIGDGFRQIYPTIWLDLVFNRATQPIIISDVRYVNEFMRVKKEGGLNILVGRTEMLSDDPNGSEAQIRPYVEWCLNNFSAIAPVCKLPLNPNSDCSKVPELGKFDLFVRNDGTIEDLYRSIDEQVVPYVENFVFQFNEETEQ